MDTETVVTSDGFEIDRQALLHVFVPESEENLATLEASLLALEGSPDDEALLAAIFRAAHTLKGNSESMGVSAMTACAHAVESVLEQVRRGTRAADNVLVSALLGANDALRAMIRVVAAGGDPTLGEHDGVMASLATVLRGEDSRGAMSARAPAVAAAEAGSSNKTLRVDLRTLDRIVTHLEELAIARARLRVTLERGGSVEEALDVLADAERHFDDLRERIMRLRLVPIASVFRAQSRIVRDLAPALGKAAQLVLEGEDVEVDATVLEALKGPITHLVRNALDHGLEASDARAACGKPRTGTIALRARHESSRLVVEVSDDGAGFRRDRILAQGRRLGLVAGDGASLRDKEVFELVFTAAFSTAEAVTDLSGRGVGMDIVAHDIAALKGSVDIVSGEGSGSTITLRVPLTLSIVEGFTVGVADEAYVVPLESVRECIDLPFGLAHHDDACGVISFRGGMLPFVRLRDLFHLHGAPPARESVVVVEHRGRRVGLAVDALRGRTQAVVKPLALVLRGADAICGTTLLGDGRVALLLDVPALLRDVERRRTGATS
jgi:two-component system chemotaxis sensor kinase CheA